MTAEKGTGTPPTGRLNRDRILRTAIAIADAEGLPALSMRRLGAALGVQAMSLYNHVQNKDDLIDGMAGTLIAEIVIPVRVELSWEEAMVDICIAYRRLAHAHPSLFAMVHDRALRSPESLTPFERCLADLHRAGFDPESALYAFTAAASFVAGFALSEIANGQIAPPTDASPSVLPPSVDPAAFPRVAEARRYLDRDHRDAAFAFGLDVLIAGIRMTAGYMGGSSDVRSCR